MKSDDKAEVRIKEAAKKIFQEKGFSATKTREIAEAAGINSALLNYYFRSKEKLFHIIMLDSIQEMFSFMEAIINDTNTSLFYKIEAIVNRYINICKESPHLPLFILQQLNTDAKKIIKESGIPQDLITNSYIYRQIREQLDKNNIGISPLHIIINLISLSITPHISMPLIGYLYGMDENTTSMLIEERRRLIPIWIKTILKLEED